MRAGVEAFPTIQRFAITADEIVGCEDLAFVRGTYEMTVQPGPGTTPPAELPAPS